jgi:hypothetical protein
MTGAPLWRQAGKSRKSLADQKKTGAIAVAPVF